MSLTDIRNAVLLQAPRGITMDEDPQLGRAQLEIKVTEASAEAMGPRGMAPEVKTLRRALADGTVSITRPF